MVTDNSNLQTDKQAKRHTDITLWNSLPVQLCNPDIIYGLFR